LTAPQAPRFRFSDGVDIHSHPLPGIDDGSTSFQDSLGMLCVAARYGTRVMIATPHRYWGGRENTPDLVRRLTADVQAELMQRTAGHVISLLPGQEIPLRPETAEELLAGKVLSLGDAGKYCLVEPPFDNLPGWIADALARIVAAGIRPVLAHPERNAIIQRDPELVREYVEAGALLQLTAMSIEGENGKWALSAATWILEQGMAGIVSSDSHSSTWRPPTLRGAYRRLIGMFDQETAYRLCAANPAAIAEGRAVNLPPAPFPKREGV
jgi:protein-tyrosine phosphatase